MTSRFINRSARVGIALAAVATSLVAAMPAHALVQPAAAATYRPTREVQLSVGEGQMVNLPRGVTDVWTSNPAVADVYVSNPRQVSLFGKGNGEATIIATASDGSVVYGAKVRVSQNISSIDQMIRAAMPDANITVTTVGQMAVINGTVASPADASQAETLVKTLLNPGVDLSKEGAPLHIIPVNRLKVATPLQVTLKVKIAEVNRDLIKQIGINFMSSDSGSGIKFGIGQGLPSSTAIGAAGGYRPFPLIDGTFDGAPVIGLAGKLLGVDLQGTLNLAEKDGLVTVLAEPNLTALSGETAAFLAGGEFPIPVSQSLGSIAIEYKQYGVGLAFTPIVLSDGRISMRVRPEVSELSTEGQIKLNDFVVPSLTVRRAETTVELGSGQSFMIAGLLRNKVQNEITKAPGLGDLPIIGTLFRSTRYRRQETELVIIVTPYLVRPTSAQLPLPTDGLRVPNDATRILRNQTFTGVSGPTASAAAPAAAAVAAPAPGFKM